MVKEYQKQEKRTRSVAVDMAPKDLQPQVSFDAPPPEVGGFSDLAVPSLGLVHDELGV